MESGRRDFKWGVPIRHSTILNGGAKSAKWRRDPYPLVSAIVSKCNSRTWGAIWASEPRESDQN
ncbi:hypothetical protein N7486_005769 [Penicillium sp. IBT 16267x]|nr:hypothetical protein N7486_005769 [Penicillium sp. IBT 16267x]